MQNTFDVFQVASATGLCNVYAEVFSPQGQPRLVLQIAHGMAEHITRYHDFASFLANHGIVVALNDHAGHGKSCTDPALLGHFADKDGWSAVIADMHSLHTHVTSLYPTLPYVLMGHSMGSLLARTYAARYPSEVDACIFSGANGKNAALATGRIIARLERKRNGPRVPSSLLKKLCFGSFNKAFTPNRTASDWLSRDEHMVDQYVADPLCGYAFTAEAMLDLFDGMAEVSSLQWAARVPNVPILLFSGESDPVGGNGKGVKQVYKWLTDTDHTRITLKLYPQGRHEMLNETNRQDVYEDILAFLKTCMG